jgi:hypothetical protein
MVLSEVLRCVLYNIVCPCWFCPIQNTSKKVRQYNGQNQQGQTMLYKTHRRTSDNIMAKTIKDKQCHTKHIKERQTMVLSMVLSDLLRCALHNIVCSCWFWSWYCLTFFNLFWITLFVLVGFGHGSVWRSSSYTKHFKERQKIPWPKPTRTNNVMQNTSKNVRQYHGQNQLEQTMLFKTHRRFV